VAIWNQAQYVPSKEGHNSAVGISSVKYNGYVTNYRRLFRGNCLHSMEELKYRKNTLDLSAVEGLL
jgi:hypothetical protein